MPRHPFLLAACALGAAASLLGAACSSGATSGSSVGGCRAERVAMTHIRGSNGAGQTGYQLTVKNTGTAPCLFRNQPRLTLLGRHGNALPTHVHWTGSPKSVTIAPGKTVRARLRFSPDVPGPGEQHKGRCEPEARHVRVYLRSGAKTLGYQLAVTGPVRPATSVCEHGRITASPLR